MIGLFRRFTPRHVKVYADVYSLEVDAVKKYVKDVQDRSFPAEENSFTMKEENAAQLREGAGALGGAS